MKIKSKILISLLLFSCNMNANVLDGNISYQSISHDESLAVKPVVINGSQASMEDFPYYARLVYTDFSTTYGDFCGGSVLNSRFILTAAHCVENKEASELAIIVNNGNTVGVKFNELNHISKIHMHSEYTRSDFANDIAIIELKEPLLDFTKVFLPENKLNYENRDILTVMGLGYSDNIDTKPDFIQRGDVTNIPDDVCMERIQHFYGIDFSKDQQECAITKRNEQNELVNACHGDSGGPLTYKSGGFYKQIALTSYGSSFGCTDQVTPKVFTEILGYSDWIKSIAGDFGEVKSDDDTSNSDDSNSQTSSGTNSSGGSLSYFFLFALTYLANTRRLARK